ncbi:class F sortase [Agreia sp. Leaf335]|uniref:class F sortase n=1 Tax=Agreia sp. Leaf335 TaxID=1736340 RepID=UPI001F203600|nr:class F sortase [Agreia sp. Leaf335]
MLVAAGIAAVAIVSNGALSSLPRDMNGKPVTYEADSAPKSEASAVPNGDGRLVVSSVGLDVPIGSLNAVEGIVSPPGFTSAYLIRNYGVTPKDSGLGTVYIVMHSLRNGGTGPGNYLIDVENEKAQVRRGDEIDVDGTKFRVTGSQRLSKDQLPSSEIWSASPNTLVVITCLQRPDGQASTDNMVITAERVLSTSQ